MSDSYAIVPHPDTGAPLIDLDHGQYGLGLKPKLSSPNANRYPPVGLSYPDFAPDQLTEQDFEYFCPPVMDQGQSSACGPHALVEALATSFAIDSDERPLLSPWFVYGVLNHGRDNGTALPDLLAVAEQTGVPPADLVRAGDFSGRYAQSVYDAAAAHKIEAAYAAANWSNLLSSCERRQVSVIGIDIGGNFNPDSQGFLPPFQPSPQGVLGHALSVMGKKYAGNEWWLKVRNHWTVQWGLNGSAFLPQSYINPSFGAWTARTVRANPSSQPPAVA